MKNTDASGLDGGLPRRWMTIRRMMVLGLAGLGLVIAIFYVEENIRHMRAWKAYQRSTGLDKKSLDWRAGLPKPLPEADNFAATPLLKAIGTKGQIQPDISSRLASIPAGMYLADAFEGKPADFDGFVTESLSRGHLTEDAQLDAVQLALRAFQPVGEDLSELRLASLRPGARFPAQGDDPWTINVPNFVAIRSLCQMLCLRADAFLTAGQSEEALKDLNVVFRLGDVLESNPTLVSAMIRVALYGVALGPIRDGVVEGKWSGKQLAELQEHLETANLVEGVAVSLQSGERASVHYLVERKPEELGQMFLPVHPHSTLPQRVSAKLVEWGIWLVPRGWHYHALMNYDREMLEFLASIDSQEQRVDLVRIQRATDRVRIQVEQGSPFNWLAGRALPNFTKACASAARTQIMLQLATAVCALERFKLDNGSYPVSLDELTPNYLSQTIYDRVTRTGFAYRQRGDGRYLISSRISVISPAGTPSEAELAWMN